MLSAWISPGFNGPCSFTAWTLMRVKQQLAMNVTGNLGGADWNCGPRAFVTLCIGMWIKVWLCAALALGAMAGEALQGAALLKTDLMFVGAHPDDETGIAAVLARYAGQNKTVAAVYCTRGEGGGNMVGTQAGPALGILREAELRECLATLGVRYVYFLDEEDFFYTESLAATLEKWDREEVLGKLVRVVRSLRPDVIVTMNPAPNPGQHGHHQAAGVLATEAFAAAADAKRFPEQLTHEGLEPWQVRKLYYSGSAEPNVKVRTDETLPNGKVPAELAAQALVHHRSQAFGNFGNSPWLRRPSSFVLARTAVEVTLPESDLLDSVGQPPNAMAQSKITGASEPKPVFEFVPRPAITRFKKWARENHVQHTASAFVADIPVVMAPRAQEVVLRAPARLPEAIVTSISEPNWTVHGPSRKDIGNDLAEYTFRVFPGGSPWRDAKLTAKAGSLENSIVLHSIPVFSVHNRKVPDDLAGSSISQSNVFQGKIEHEQDLQASFGVEFDRKALIVSVRVQDDQIVSNIAPNDIKGHWRSDSVEICIDPNPGSEHTLNTFKLGIFPFDSTGQVRGARDADANQGPIERTAPEVKLHSERRDDGYTIRAKIPWKYIGAKPKKGTMLGFNIIVYDGDKKDAVPGENINEARIAWSPRPGVQGRPEDWGRIVLQ
jgi:LmbE family N-acetylglucosaminyl deacetylase